MREQEMPWEEIRRRFERREKNGRELAEEYGVSYQKLYRKAADQGWEGYQRRAETNPRRQIERLARQLIRMTRDAAARTEPEDIKTVKELAGVLQTLAGLEKALGGETAQDRTVQVVMDSEVEEMSR